MTACDRYVNTFVWHVNPFNFDFEPEHPLDRVIHKLIQG